MTIAALSLVPAWVLANVPGERRARARDAGSDAGGDAADEAAETDCTIRISAGDMAQLMSGGLNPMMAYTLGKLKIEGSLGVAMKVASLLEE